MTDHTPPTVQPRGIWCWGCGRRYVWGDTPAAGLLDDIAWEEGLCDKQDCPAYTIVGGKR